MLLKGKAMWAKIVGPAVLNKFSEKKEWSFDLCNLTPETVETLKKEGVGHTVKNKGDDRGDFVTLRRKEMKSDGTPAKPIEVVDHHGNPWGKELIGNGSELQVIASVRETKFKGKIHKVLSPIKVLVWDHVKYAGREDFDYNKSDTTSITASGSW